MAEEIRKITIVGGGDAGLLSGLCLRQVNPDVDIVIVDDFERDIPPLGKSTTVKIIDILHQFLEIDVFRFMSEVKPIWKGSVYFRDWCGYEPFHYPFDVDDKFADRSTENAVEKEYYLYQNFSRLPEFRTRGEEIVEQRKSAIYMSPTDRAYDVYDDIAYHLNTTRFNTFLRELCEERNVELVNDDITAVDATGDRIERVRSETAAYESDLFVDASGFNRVLKSEVGGDFVDFGFPLDSAFNTRVDRSLSDVVPATIVDTGDSGWFWTIDTFDNRDMGYVYASDYVSDEEARTEFIEFCDGDVTESDVEKYGFSSGFYRDAWKENCIVIGNAGGFVEPLQSTGLTTNAWAAMTLSEMLSSHACINDAAIREKYNAWVEQIWESIYDFISIHYAFSDGDTPFWRAMGSIETSDRVHRIIEEYDRHGFSTTGSFMRKTHGLLAFTPRDFLTMMRNMGVESEFYETLDLDVSDRVKRDQEAFHEDVLDTLKDHLTVEEFYKGVLEQNNRLQGARYQ